MEISILPKFILKKIIPNTVYQYHFNVLMSNILILIIGFLFSFFGALNIIPGFCIVDRTLGIPCPGCGITRSISSILRLNIIDSWAYNPAGIVIVFYFFMQIPLRLLILVTRKKVCLVEKILKVANIITVFSIFLVWFERVVLKIL